jgi:hypothetical protein
VNDEGISVIGSADRGQFARESRERRSGLAPVLQTTEVFLKKRRKARNPVMPMPKRASEAGSGTETGVKTTLMFEAVTLSLKPVRKYDCRWIGTSLQISTTYEALEVAGKLSVTAGYMVPKKSREVTLALAVGKPVRLWIVTVALVGVRSISTSVAVPPVTLKLPLRS